MDNINEKYDLMTRNLKEVIGEERIKPILEKEEFRVYWGTAPTNLIHIGYFVPLLKIADFLEAGCHVTILIADLHAYLDNMKSTMEQLIHRCNYYESLVRTIIDALNINYDKNKLVFIRGSEFQLSKEYTLDVYKLNSMVTYNVAKKSGAEVVKYSDNPLMSGLLYPSLQILDEKYLNAHGELGGCDQRKIFAMGNDYMPKLGYNKCIYFMNDIIPGLRYEPLSKKEDSDDSINDEFENKMSSSKQDSKIDILDEQNVIKTKINKVYCLPGNINDNSLLPMTEHIIFPILKRKKLQFMVKRKEKFGGNILYDNFGKLKDDFEKELLHPGDFKSAIVDNLNVILEPIRSMTKKNKLTDVIKMAYHK